MRSLSLKEMWWSLLLLPILVTGQNLVPNCDFDYYTSCPNWHGQFDRVSEWYTPTEATTDLCHTCAAEIVGIPVNMWGNQQPYSGLGYGHIISYYSFTSPQYREYMQVELSCELIAGEDYRVSFFVSCSDNSGYGIDAMGLHFTNDPLLKNGITVLDIGGPPEISNPAGSFITDKDGWVEIRGTYQATGGERYITIGNFLPDEETGIYDFPGNLSNYASYYVSHVSVMPVMSWLQLGNDTTLCKGESITVDATIACGATYHWSDGDSVPVKVLSQAGTYTVTASLGCGSISDAITMSWTEAPEIQIPLDTFLCFGESVLLNAGEGFTSYSWQDGSQQSTFIAGQPGTYWVQVTDQHDCTYRDSTIVRLLPAPDVSLGEDGILCMGDSIILYAGNENLMGSYVWQDLTVADSLKVKSQGIYWVRVSNPCGSSSDTIMIGFKDCQTLVWLPNSFTPNGDGENDLFQARGVNLTSFSLYIYNRWGELVFESDDIDRGWDGNKSGKPCPGDIYVWLVKYTGFEEESNVHTQKGNVLLLK